MADPYIVISSEGGEVYSNEIQSQGIGVEIQSNLTGLGLPPVSAQFDESLGDGATYRGTRNLSRSIDFTAHIYAPTRTDLRSIADRFSIVLAYPCTITFVDPDATESWAIEAHRTGGGDYNYGQDSDGTSYVNMSWSMQSDQPFWLSEALYRFSAAANRVPNSSFEEDATGIGTASGWIATSNLDETVRPYVGMATVPAGVQYARYKFNTDTPNGGQHAVTQAGLVPVAAYETVTASVYVRASNNLSLSVDLRWRDASNGIISTTLGVDSVPGFVPNGDDWPRLSTTGTAPAGTASVDIMVRNGNGALTGQFFDIDAVMATEGPVLLPYSDIGATFVTDNPGTHTARPVYRIHGPTSGFSIAGPTGEVVTYDDYVPQDETIVVDTTTGLATNQDGEDRFASLYISSIKDAEVPRGITAYTFTSDQTSPEFNTSQVRTNYATNPNFVSDPDLHGDYEYYPNFQGWDSVNQRFNYRKANDATSGLTPNIRFEVTGLTVGEQYICRAMSQQVMLSKRWKRSGGVIRAYDHGTLVAARGFGWNEVDPASPFGQTWVASGRGTEGARMVNGGWPLALNFTASSTTMRFWIFPPNIHHPTKNLTAEGSEYDGLPYPGLEWVYVGESGGYFDGSTPNVGNRTYAWSGVADQSTSTETTALTAPDTALLSCEVEFRARRWLVI